jgi:hypothetical protein
MQFFKHFFLLFILNFFITYSSRFPTILFRNPCADVSATLFTTLQRIAHYYKTELTVFLATTLILCIIFKLLFIIKKRKIIETLYNTLLNHEKLDKLYLAGDIHNALSDAYPELWRRRNHIFDFHLQLDYFNENHLNGNTIRKSNKLLIVEPELLTNAETKTSNFEITLKKLMELTELNEENTYYEKQYTLTFASLIFFKHIRNSDILKTLEKKDIKHYDYIQFDETKLSIAFTEKLNPLGVRTDIERAIAKPEKSRGGYYFDENHNSVIYKTIIRCINDFISEHYFNILMKKQREGKTLTYDNHKNLKFIHTLNKEWRSQPESLS